MESKVIAEYNNKHIIFFVKPCDLTDGMKLYAGPQEEINELKAEITRLRSSLVTAESQRDLLAEASRITRKYLKGTKEQVLECDLVLGFALIAMKGK